MTAFAPTTLELLFRAIAAQQALTPADPTNDRAFYGLGGQLYFVRFECGFGAGKTLALSGGDEAQGVLLGTFPPVHPNVQVVLSSLEVDCRTDGSASFTGLRLGLGTEEATGATDILSGNWIDLCDGAAVGATGSSASFSASGTSGIKDVRSNAAGVPIYLNTAVDAGFSGDLELRRTVATLLYRTI